MPRIQKTMPIGQASLDIEVFEDDFPIGINAYPHIFIRGLEGSEDVDVYFDAGGEWEKVNSYGNEADFNTLSKSLNITNPGKYQLRKETTTKELVVTLHGRGSW